MARVLSFLLGFVIGAVAGFVFALTFGSQLFGWHDNIGPELRFAFFGGLAGACIALVRRSVHEHQRREASQENRDE